MVVQHNLTAMNSNRMLGITTGSQAKSTEKLSSGYKINRAADDAAGLTISEKMRKQIRGLDRASTNAQDGISCVQTAEGALTEVHSMLQRMNELAVQAANGTMSQDDRQAVQDEIDQLVTEIDRVSATTKFNEIYLLKGAEGTETSETKTTYSYDLTAAAEALSKGAINGLTAGAAPIYGAKETNALTGAAGVLEAAKMELDTATLGTNKLFVSPTGAAVATGTDFVEVTDADLTAYFDIDDAGTVTLKAGITACTAGNATLANAGGGTAVTDANVGTAAIKGTAAVTDPAVKDYDNYVELDENGELKYKEGKILYTADADTTGEYGDQIKTVAIKEEDLKNYFDVSSNPLKDIDTGETVTDISKYFENGAYKGGLAIMNTATTPVLTEIGADQIDTYINTTATSRQVTVVDALEFNLHVGSESATSNKIGVKIESISASGIGVDVLKGSGLKTEKDATAAIDTIADAIAKVSQQRSALGAIQNRLEHTIANLDNVVENTTAAESRIRDTDMAEEMVEYSKNNILAQAGQSMLAQANQSTQGVLSLLG
ncbi:MAG: flagellar hook protein [Eubacterium sp.]|nr:flagellar hook protein [Eubacterium sp.]